jgi:succinate dehydrogenase flavin-adding protein (antitoxin of CptAB toxin-antitoxin module)
MAVEFAIILEHYSNKEQAMDEFAERDSDNLDFLLSLDKAGLVVWFMQATPDDVAYAMELMAQHSEQLAIEQSLNTTEWIESAVVLERFRLH